MNTSFPTTTASTLEAGLTTTCTATAPEHGRTATNMKECTNMTRKAVTESTHGRVASNIMGNGRRTTNTDTAICLSRRLAGLSTGSGRTEK